MKFEYKIKLLNIIINSHVTEKSNYLLNNFDKLVLKVNKNYNKIDIKNSVSNLFNLKVKSVNTLIIKTKSKRNIKNNKFSNIKLWKKAYVTIEKNQNLIYLNKLNEINNNNIYDYNKI